MVVLERYAGRTQTSRRELRRHPKRIQFFRQARKRPASDQHRLDDFQSQFARGRQHRSQFGVRLNRRDGDFQGARIFREQRRHDFIRRNDIVRTPVLAQPFG